MKRISLLLVSVIVLAGCLATRHHRPLPHLPPVVKHLAPRIQAKLASAPNITSNPTNVIVVPGSNATFSVKASGTSPLSYQWSFGGVNIDGATTNVYTATNITTAGFYTVTVTNLTGMDTASAYAAVGTTSVLSNCLSGPLSVTLAWCPSSEPNVAGYNVYQGVGDMPYFSGDVYSSTNPCSPALIPGTNFCRCYTNMVAVGNVTNTIMTNLPRGVTNYFAVTAYDSNGLESAFSGEVSVTAASIPPLTFSTGILPINNNTILLSTKVCAESRMTIWYKKNLAQANWTKLLTNGVPDVFGNFFYYDPIHNGTNRFYRLQLQ